MVDGSLADWIVSPSLDGPGLVVGLRIVIRRLLPARHMKRIPSVLAPLFIAGFRAVLDALQECVGIQAVFFVVLNVAGIVIFEDHEPVFVVSAGNDGAQLFAIGNVVGQAQYLLRARLAGKLISLWNFDLPHIAQVSDIGPALPIDLWLLRLRCLWFLRRRHSGESHRQENREK